MRNASGKKDEPGGDGGGSMTSGQKRWREATSWPTKGVADGGAEGDFLGAFFC